MRKPFMSGPAGETAVGLGFVWLLALVAALWFDPFWVSVAITAILWVHLCAAWNIVGGILGQVSFGHAAFFGIGAYTSTYLASQFGISPWFGMLAGGALAAGVAWIVGFFPFRWRLSHLVFALMTLALGTALQFGVSGVAALGGNNGLFVAVKGRSFWDYRFTEPRAFLLTMAILASLVLLLSWRLYVSRTGVRWRALRDNEDAASSIGIAGFRLKQLGFTVSAFLTALAGTFYAQYVGFIDPTSVFGVAVTIEILLFAVVGGAGTLIGPVIGALLLVPVSEGLRLALSGIAGDGINHLLFGVMLMLVIRLWPGGIAGTLLSRRPRLVAPTVEAGASTRQGKTTVAPRTREEVLVVRGLRKVFGGLTAVSDVSFELYRGEILGVIGPNGAGKTTVFTMLSGFQRPTAGSACFLGQNVERLDAFEICRRGLARTFQIPQLFESFTVVEAIAAGGLNRNGAVDAMHQAGEIAARMQLAANKPCSVLTLAERRRLEIARAVATQPQVILLDEVLAGLTPKEVGDALELIRSLRDQGLTVILIEHNMKAVMNVCDRIVVLELGKVIATGTPEEVTANERVIAAYLGTASTSREKHDVLATGGQARGEVANA